MLRVFVASTDIADIYEEISLSEYRKAKLRALKPTEAKRQSAAAGLLFSRALRDCYGICEGELEYGVTEHGKPFLIRYPDIHFNLSHTDGRCAVAISDKPVGIDIEAVKTGNRHQAAAKRFFSEAERRAYGLCDGENYDITAFYRLWTAKESYVKCTGEGLAEGRRTVDIPFFTDSCMLNGMHFTRMDSCEYALTVCSYTEDTPTCERVSVYDILRGEE